VDHRKLPKGPADRALCRRCGTEVPPGRRSFCSADCVHQWKLRTDPGYLREKVLERDRGICARCGLDTVALRRHFLKLDYKARYAFLREWNLKPGFRRSLWDADHIIPVAEGGGECDLANMRTLCLKCHRAVTDLLRHRLAHSRVE
jgi:5-methylcytosine-specific restriction enzyme A